jgi:hypothetical protein
MLVIRELAYLMYLILSCPSNESNLEFRSYIYIAWKGKRAHT